MKKIAVITIKDDWNLGNRLQNFATLKILDNLGYNSMNIIYRNNYKEITFKDDVFRKIKSSYFYQLLRYLIKSNKRYDVIRNLNFKRFNKRIKNYRIEFRKNTKFSKLNNKFDFFICGSDQIWNPNLYNNDMFINTLGFTSKEKKIALSPSIACDHLSAKQEELFCKLLKDFDYLSCREELGCEQLKRISSKYVCCLVDPTLIISDNEYEAVEKKVKNVPQKYILCYFLGKINDEYREIIKRTSERLGVDIVDISPHNLNNFSCCGPEEFLYLVHNSSLVLTDSYHGSVFSLIYNKPLRLFKRVEGESMGSRIETFIHKFDCKDKIFSHDISLENYSELYYDKSRLTEEKQKFYVFLKESLQRGDNLL